MDDFSNLADGGVLESFSQLFGARFPSCPLLYYSPSDEYQMRLEVSGSAEATSRL